ncbi:Sua5/YciO/YrdC/YwlC family tRNA threonylcarbamoyl adenosine modification protein [Verruconis gallopava]|uniref:Threonylcarbamoyl-AMP synthase n=1 Tax=Verruconis gallopava TaxID=253628 RepID=A0A0D1XSA9_9PEZI|nr:Sua5/YciO/YrdC/YwlC family tRNA threonylcarbamoyl adenosine modification protein [Verruconis gallopava]KIW05631.1 Sua5/YciO/YrdC/YwlC family tRNA threonylcarbamoyl adenosine modification protein [Verruconis gallopava]
MWRPSRLHSITNVYLHRTRTQNFFLSLRSQLHSSSSAIASATMNGIQDVSCAKHTQILPVDTAKLKNVAQPIFQDGFLYDLRIKFDEEEEALRNLKLAAKCLQTSNTPVAFPTETVYGLGADATRSEAVKGIYAAKQRPADNPLIVHFSSLSQLNSLLSGSTIKNHEAVTAAVPSIYLPLIKKFWPGPLTIILPNPNTSPLAPEVTAGLDTFGARIPGNLLALLLIELLGKPIAAPSANASTKPSPTAAEHVLEDLNGRIEYIIDGGPCEVGVESTVVDGLSSPPAILRPGGISIDQLRECSGWENVVVAYEDVSMKKGQPRAPGMKYRHYSPKAKVFLYETGTDRPKHETLEKQGFRTLGFIHTRYWKSNLHDDSNDHCRTAGGEKSARTNHAADRFSALVPDLFVQRPELKHKCVDRPGGQVTYWEIKIGESASDVARNLFWALRELDRKGCEVICVEGIGSESSDVADAVMNRLRKAAEVQFDK